jgi:hypothetical protein
MVSGHDTAHEVLYPVLQNPFFPWKQNLPDYAHPQFMCTSLWTRDGERDRKRLGQRIQALKDQDKTNALVSDIVGTVKNLASSVPDSWTPSNLDIEEGEVRIVDFPSRKQSHSKNEVLDLLMENVSLLISHCCVV